MHYFDTSFVAPLILPERSSGRIERSARDLAADDLAISHWTRVEFTGLVARRVRMKELSISDADRVMTMFGEVIRSFHIILPTVSEYDLASDYLRQYKLGLRSGDALHLAIARNHEAKCFHTLDKSLLKIAGTLGIPASA
jgi:predicted nucleic acid-binding protein